jgi:two-component system, NarL family, nitrate/nitrite response regulator NarL
MRAFILARIRLYREGLAQILGGDGRVEVVGSAADWSEAAPRLRSLAPDVALVDLGLPDTVAAIRELLATVPGVRVVALAVGDVESDLIALAEAGVSGYVTAEQSVEELVVGLERVMLGEAMCSPRLASVLLRRVKSLASSRPAGGAERLTPRELEIVGLIDEGLSNKAIAQRLRIELPTVKNHVHNILEKLEVGTRAAAAARVRQATRAA